MEEDQRHCCWWLGYRQGSVEVTDSPTAAVVTQQVPVRLQRGRVSVQGTAGKIMSVHIHLYLFQWFCCYSAHHEDTIQLLD